MWRIAFHETHFIIGLFITSIHLLPHDGSNSPLVSVFAEFIYISALDTEFWVLTHRWKRLCMGVHMRGCGGGEIAGGRGGRVKGGREARGYGRSPLSRAWVWEGISGVWVLPWVERTIPHIFHMASSYHFIFSLHLLSYLRFAYLSLSRYTSILALLDARRKCITLASLLLWSFFVTTSSTGVPKGTRLGSSQFSILHSYYSMVCPFICILCYCRPKYPRSL